MTTYETETEVITEHGTRLYSHKDHDTLAEALSVWSSETRPCQIYEVRRINRNRVVKFPVRAA